MTTQEKVMFLMPQLIYGAAGIFYLLLVGRDYYRDHWSRKARQTRREFEALRRSILYPGDDK